MNKLIHVSKIILFAFFCSLCSYLAAQQKVAIRAVGTGVSKIYIDTAWGAMQEFLTKSKNYRVMDKKYIDQRFAELRDQRNPALTDQNTAKAMGKAIGADLMCMIEITKEEGYININISLTNVETSETPKSSSELVGANLGNVRDAVDMIASRITGIEGKIQKTVREGRKVENRALRRNRTFGIYASGGLPIGEFGSMEFAPTFEFPVTQSEGYDFGYGGRATINFPLFFKALGMRLGGGFIMNNGANTAPGYATLDLKYTAFGASGELQLFFDESFRHKGTYLFGGATVNQESFSRSSDGFTDVYRKKMRFGGTAGIGHTFSKVGGAGGWTVEVAYHTTLTSKDVNASEAVGADYVRFSIGLVF